jgi:hypothetical protein
MPLADQYVTELGQGALYSFADWPHPSVPTFGAGVYTVWHNDSRFIYVGMSGRGITADTVRRNTPQGIYTRLQSHASGRRSGDQFCVYVADRLVLPTLSQEDTGAIAVGRHQMDAFVRRYIHENLSYRFVMVPDAATAFAKLRSKAANGCTVAHFSIPEGSHAVPIRASARLHPAADADVAHLPARDGPKAPQGRGKGQHPQPRGRFSIAR